MADLPLLFFPSPETASKTPGHGFGGNLNRPSAQRQGQRLNPIFQQLQNSFNARSIELQQTPAGIDPEQVLVIETVGNIEDFANAVKKVSGLEWMGEFVLDSISPDEDFQDKKDSKKELSGCLYLIMSNQKALSQMLSLWQKYTKNPDTMNFQRGGEYWGLAKFKDIFLHMKDIRRWDVKDRLAERKVFDMWQEDIESDPQRSVRFEAELWYRGKNHKRRKSATIVSELIQNLGGRVISECVIHSIAYHSVLGEIPAEKALQIIEQPEVDLIRCENIMFFRPTGQIVIGKEPIEGDVSDYEFSEGDLPAGDPVVALLDGLPLENHRLLADRLIIEDPDDWALDYPAIDRQHGTAMASLIVNGDLNSGSPPLKRPVYVRPIMKPVRKWFKSPRPEQLSEDVLFVDYVHRAVRRIVEGEGEDEPAAPTVKIINLSIGDSLRPFSQMMSPLARLLDWLSVKYNLLFIISSGNHLEEIDIGISGDDFLKLNITDRESLVVNKLYEDMRHRRLLSPAESINGLTVGALHADASQDINLGHQFNPFQSELPSPVSPFGSGYRSSIKPDFITPGGRVLYDTSIGSNHIEPKDTPRGPGHQAAAPSTQAGPPDKIKFCCGSSNSAALTSRAAGIAYDYLESIFQEQARGSDFATFGIPILKAALVHGCSWNRSGERLDTLLKADGNAGKTKNKISKWLGYGVPDFEKALGCNDQRATLIGFGRLNDGKAHVYQLPLPPSLNAKRERRRFTVTLAWLSPVVSTTQRYREALLWFDFEDGKESRDKLEKKIHVKGIESDHYATRRGTVQYEIFEGETAAAISDGDFLRIKVNCRNDARKISSPIGYGLIVSLEVAEGVNLPIYNEIRTRIAPAVEIRAGG